MDNRVFLLTQKVGKPVVTMYRARLGEGATLDGSGEHYTSDVSKARRFYGMDDVDVHRKQGDRMIAVETRRS